MANLICTCIFGALTVWASAAFITTENPAWALITLFSAMGICCFAFLAIVEAE